MTELQAVNTIISYTGEDPFDAAPTGLMPTYDRAKVILDESVDSANRTLTTNYTITTIPNKLVDYIVKRACRGYYTRTVGFEEKGLEVIMVDEKQSLGSAIHYIVDNMFTVASTYKSMVLDLGKTANSIEEAYASIDIALDKLNAIEVPSVLTGKKIEEYRLAVFQLESGSELGMAERNRLIKSIRLSTLAASAVKPYFHAYILKNLKGESAAETTDEVSIYQSTIGNLVGSSDKVKMAELMLMDGNSLPHEEQIRLAKTVALGYLASKAGISYFKNYILKLCSNATTTDEVTSIVDSLEDDINAISAPANLGSEDQNLYKLSVLTGDKETIAYINKKFAKSYLQAKPSLAYFHTYILKNLVGSTYDEIQDEIDAYEDTISTLAGSDEMRMAILQLNDGNQIGQEEKTRLLERVRLSTINANFVGSEYFASYALTQIKGTTVEQIEAEANMILKTISQLSGSNEEKMAELMLVHGNNMPQEEQIRLAKIVAKANISSATAYYADFILASIKGVTVTEVQDEIDAFEAKIADITVPAGLNIEEGKRYKLAVLQLTLGSELGKVEKDTLIKSITHATIRSVMVDAKYDIVKSNIAPLVDFTSVDSITNSITSIKEKLDAIANNITTAYPSLAGKTIVYEYALNKLLAEAKDEIAMTKEMALIQSIAKLVVDSLSLTAEEKTVFMSMPIENQNIKAIEDVSRNVNIIINALEESRKNILGEGWKFNTITTELVPDALGYIAIPSSHLVVYSTQNNDITIRDHKLFNSTDLTYIFTESEEVTYIDDIPLDDLPQYMIHYIIETASLKTHIGILGEDANTQNKREGVQRARMEALRVDANNRDGNILEHAFVTTLLDRENL